MLIALGLLLLAAPPLASWILLVRTRSWGLAVATVVVGAAAALACAWAGVVELRGEAELTLAYPVAAALLVGLSSRLEERRLGPRALSPIADRTVVLLLAVQLSAVLPLAALYALVFTGETAEPPSADEVRSLPAGLRVTAVEKQCGSGGCWREMTVQSPEGLAPGEVVAVLERSGVETCRPHGWVLDPRDVCVAVEQMGEHVRLVLTLQ